MNKIIVVTLVLVFFVSVFADEFDDYLKAELLYVNEMDKLLDLMDENGELLKKRYPNDLELKDFIDSNMDAWDKAMTKNTESLKLTVKLWQILGK